VGGHPHGRRVRGARVMALGACTSYVAGRAAVAPMWNIVAPMWNIVAPMWNIVAPMWNIVARWFTHRHQIHARTRGIPMNLQPRSLLGSPVPAVAWPQNTVLSAAQPQSPRLPGYRPPAARRGGSCKCLGPAVYYCPWAHSASLATHPKSAPELPSQQSRKACSSTALRPQHTAP
jgi:hypothetical protein